MSFVLYAIRHKPTGAFMPMRWETWQHGYTHDEPTPGAVPRLFRTEQNARQALRAWLNGRWVSKYHSGRYGYGGFEEPEWWLDVKPVDGRNADDMEIVSMALTTIDDGEDDDLCIARSV